MSSDDRFRCSAVARWLPRTLAAAVLVASAIASTRIYSGVAGTGYSHSRTLVVLFGAVAALMIVRYGAHVRTEFRFGSEALQLFHGKQTRELPYEQIVSMNYDAPFARGRDWLAALVLVDRFGTRWRIPSLINGGDRFVRALVETTARDDLASFASAYGLEQKMGRTRGRLWIGYALALLIILLSLLLAFTAPSGAA